MVEKNCCSVSNLKYISKKESKWQVCLIYITNIFFMWYIDKEKENYFILYLDTFRIFLGYHNHYTLDKEIQCDAISFSTYKPLRTMRLMNRNNLWTNSILDALCTFLNSQEQKWGELLGGRACRCWGQKIKSGSTSYGNFFLQEVIAHTKQSTAFAILLIRWIRMMGKVEDIMYNNLLVNSWSHLPLWSLFEDSR